MKAPAENRSVLCRLLFLAYSAIMLWLLFGQRLEGGQLSISFENSRENVNFVPFETVRLYIRLLKSGAGKSLLRHAIVNLVGNVVMFVPLGWFLPAVWGKMRSFYLTFSAAAAAICLVEAGQYLTALGSCDIDDLILNLLGVILGYGIWKVTYRK